MMEEGKSNLVSIIVPVYQVKEYVGACVESLMAQTYTNLEILLVDDGSIDGSGEICDEYACRDDRIRVIHQENQGLSAARNTGLDQAMGEYVAFVDSDDAVLPSYIEELYCLIKKYHADIVACAYTRGKFEKNRHSLEVKREHVDEKCDDSVTLTYGAKRRLRIEAGDCYGGEICMTSGQMLRQWHGKYKKWETVAWNKLYRKEIFDGIDGESIRFPVGKRHEDVLTSHRIVANASRIVLTTRKLYLYRIRVGSITMQTMTAEHRRDNLRAQRERIAFFKEKRYWRAYLNLLAGYVLHLGWFAWMRVRE